MRTIIFIALLTACSSHLDAPPPSPQPQPQPVSKTLEASTDLAGLVSRMQYEAEHRPATQPSTESVLAALDTADIRLEKRRQYLAAVMRAAYCAGGTTKDGVAISICEYATADAAASGKAYADRQFASITSATRVLHGAAVLTVVGSPEVAERARRAFIAL